MDGLIKKAIERPIAVLSVIFLIVLFGYVALRTIPIQMSPDIEKPQLQVRVSSNLTSELSNQVLNGKIDGALITLPDNLDKELIVRPILNEPLMVLAPIDQSGKTDVELLKRNSFISFNRRAAVSRIIEIELRRMKIEVDAIMELDTLEIFHTMILEGLGVGILPMSSVRNHLREKLYMVPFGSPPVQRKIVMVQLENHHRQPMLDRVYNALVTSAQQSNSKV